MPRRDARIMRRIRIDTFSVSSVNARRILRKRYPSLTKLSSFYIPSRTAYVYLEEHRKKDLRHNREKRIIRLREGEVTIVRKGGEDERWKQPPKRTSIDRNFIAEVTVAPKFTSANIKGAEYNTIGNCLLSLISDISLHPFPLHHFSRLREEREQRSHLTAG